MLIHWSLRPRIGKEQERAIWLFLGLSAAGRGREGRSIPLRGKRIKSKTAFPKDTLSARRNAMSNADDPTQGPGAIISPESLAIGESTPAEVGSHEGRASEPEAGEQAESPLEAGELRIARTYYQPITQVGRYVSPTTFLRRVSGRYRSTGSTYQLELRVDVDGVRPMGRVSGDFFSVSGGTSSYVGSFAVDSPTVQVTSSQVTIEGIGDYTWSASAPRVKVTIPRTSIFVAAAAATFQFFTLSGSPRAIYTCPFLSSFFRTVQWEQDSVTGTVPFVSYNTGSLPRPSGVAVRDLTVSQAFADAGIEMQTTGGVNVVNTSAAGSDAKWSDSELHAAMVANFSLFADVPQWKTKTRKVGGGKESEKEKI
jgi:hypothetical protein